MFKQPIRLPVTDLDLLKSHPQWALANKIYQTLKRHHYETYFAGGCVRDLLLGVKAQDIDIATSATPDQVNLLFAKSIDVGQSFGVTRIVEDGQVIEVAVFRNDGDYKDGRRPESIQFSDPEHDAERRDFTINALFLDLEKSEVIDYVGGIEDLKNKLIRTVGDPVKRFNEDHLRILRALRFSAQLGFEIEAPTLDAVKNKKQSLQSVSSERVREEILKLLKSSGAVKGLELMSESGVFEVLLMKPPNNAASLWQKLFPLPKDLKNEIFWLALFWPLFEEDPKNNWNQDLARVSLSRSERKALDVALDFIIHREEWIKSTLGEKIIFIHENLGPSLLAFTAISQAKATIDWHSEFLNLKKEYLKKAPQGALPESFLKGEDVTVLVGPARGVALHEAFVAQLEDLVKSRVEALSWFKDYQKGLKK